MSLGVVGVDQRVDEARHELVADLLGQALEVEGHQPGRLEAGHPA
jgi:hypothetical protein